MNIPLRSLCLPFVLALAVVVASQAIAQRPRDVANYRNLGFTSPEAVASISSSNAVAVYDKGVITVWIKNVPQSFAVTDQFVSPPPGADAKAIRGKVKDIKHDPGSWRMPVRWMAPETIAFGARWTKNSYDGKDRVSEGIAAWTPNLGASLISVCDFSIDGGDASMPLWDINENGTWAALGGNPAVGMSVRFGRGIGLPETRFDLPVFVPPFGNAPGNFIQPDSITSLRTLPGRGVWLESGFGKLGYFVCTGAPIFLAPVDNQSFLRYFAVGQDASVGIDESGSIVNFSETGARRITPSTADQTFDGELACSPGGVWTTFASHNGDGPYEAVNPVKGVGVVIKKQPGPTSERVRPSQVMVNDDGTVAWVERTADSTVLKMDNGTQTCVVLQTGQRLFGSVLVDFQVNPVQNLNIHNVCTVTYTLANGNSGVATVKLDVPIVRTATPVYIPGGSDVTVVLDGENFDGDGRDTLIAVTASGRALKTRTKSNQSNERTFVFTIPAASLSTDEDVTFTLVSASNGQKSKNYVGHVTLIR